MSFNNNLKSYSYSKGKELLNLIDINSNNVVNKIKGKIYYMKQYEIYTSNLDYIDYINNNVNRTY